jgi:hypothetical protein
MDYRYHCMTSRLFSCRLDSRTQQGPPTYRSGEMSLKRDLSFMDAAWLQTYGLSRDNVLDYFYLSPFYDLTSNNQTIRAQRVTTIYLLNLIGLEFILESNNQLSLYEPTLFVIKKQYRKSSHHAEVLEVFYVMEGIIYQSPSFIDLLNIKYNKISLYLQQSFQISLNESQHMNEGHSCLLHPSVVITHDRKTSGSSSSYVKIREFPSLTSTILDLEVMASSLVDSEQIQINES